MGCKEHPDYRATHAPVPFTNGSCKACWWKWIAKLCKQTASVVAPHAR